VTRTKIYDTEGYEYGKEKGERNEQIPKFFTSGVKAIFDVSSTSFKIICYFRASEEGGKAESFYAEYGSDSSGNAFQKCKEAIEREAEDLGLEMDYSHESTHILRDMEGVDPEFPGISETYERGIRRLIQKDEKERLDFGASDYNVATRAAKAAVYKNRIVAIGDNGRVSAIKNVDVVFDTGYNGRGLEPSKETETKIKKEMVPSGSRRESSGTDDKDTLNARVRSAFSEYAVYVLVWGIGMAFLFLAFGPLSDSVGISFVDGAPDILKNAVEACLILAAAMVILGMVSRITTGGVNIKILAVGIFVITVVAFVFS